MESFEDRINKLINNKIEEREKYKEQSTLGYNSNNNKEKSHSTNQAQKLGIVRKEETLIATIYK